MAEGGSQMVDKENGRGNGFAWVLVVLLLAAWAVSLVVLRPAVVFPGVPHRVGRDMWPGILILCSCILLAVLVAHWWRTRHERKRVRLIDDRLWAQEEDLGQILNRKKEELDRQAAVLEEQAAELDQQAAPLKKQAAELRRQGKAAELRKQEVREQIRKEELLLEQRQDQKVPPESPREPAGT
jgi:hypothetical protein